MRYILVVASETPAVELGIKTARAWVDAGARYICAWGPDSEGVHESFDYAGFLPEYGEEVELVTTAHRDEPIEEALWFAFSCAKSVEPDRELNVVVIVVDSDSLETGAGFGWRTTKADRQISNLEVSMPAVGTFKNGGSIDFACVAGATRLYSGCKGGASTSATETPLLETARRGK